MSENTLHAMDSGMTLNLTLETRNQLANAGKMSCFMLPSLIVEEEKKLSSRLVSFVLVKTMQKALFSRGD